MSYDTSYYLDVKGDDPALETVGTFLADLEANTTTPEGQTNPQARFWTEVIRDGIPTPWYKYRENMVQASLKWPGALFLLEGQGEDRDDNWKEYCRNGKVLRLEPTVSWPDFDPEQMTDPANLSPHLA